MPVHSTPSYHATLSHIKTYTQFKWFSQSISSFLRLQILPFHVLCCTMKSAFLTLHLQQAINLVGSSTTPLPCPPLSLCPISCHCLSLPPATSCLLVLPSSTSQHNPAQKCLFPTSPPKHLPCFIPFACHQPPTGSDFLQTLLALTGLIMALNGCEMGRAKASNSLSLFFLPLSLIFKGKNCKHHFKDWMWLKLHWRGQSVPAQKVVGRESKQKQIV